MCPLSKECLPCDKVPVTAKRSNRILRQNFMPTGESLERSSEASILPSFVFNMYIQQVSKSVWGQFVMGQAQGGVSGYGWPLKRRYMPVEPMFCFFIKRWKKVVFTFWLMLIVFTSSQVLNKTAFNQTYKILLVSRYMSYRECIYICFYIKFIVLLTTNLLQLFVYYVDHIGMLRESMSISKQYML